MTPGQNQFFYPSADELNSVIISKIDKSAEVVLDIGCGIVPMTFFRPSLHIMMEPWKEYSDILTYRHQDDKSVIIIRQGALEGLQSLGDRSVDSIFMLDVIEHMPKDVGLNVLEQCGRVARSQIVVFTPLGFMPQHMDPAIEKDGWGLNGTQFQEHKSGWLPGDFSSSYDFHICDSFHHVDFRGAELASPFGAFFAICNLPKDYRPEQPTLMSHIRRPLPSEIQLNELRSKYDQLQLEYNLMAEELGRQKDAERKQ